MTDLRRYTATDIPALLRAARGAGRRLVVRDDARAWFMFDDASGAWRSGDGTVTDHVAAPERFEGPAFLPCNEARPDPLPVAPNLVEGFERIAGRLRAGYARGELTTAGVEARLTDFYGVDTLGRVWTIGFSQTWYAFAGGTWHPAARPGPEIFLDLTALGAGLCASCYAVTPGASVCGACGVTLPAPPSAAVIAAIEDFALHGMGTLPEGVAFPWDPPPPPSP